MVLLLLGAAMVLVKAMAPLRHSRWFALRYAARRIGRPGSQARPVLIAVGLGVFLVLGVRLLQDDLLAEFQVTARPDMPDMFLIDVQPDQVQGVSAFLARPALGVRGASALIPVLRARVTGVKGLDVNLDSAEDVRGRSSLGREYVITYRAVLERNERVIDGTFWPATASSVPEVSIERSLRDRQRLAVGDLVRFDILGRAIEARVTSVRNVDWADARAGGFMFVFRPGPLDAAPQTFIAPVKGPTGATARARFQRDLTAQFPNVSVVDVQEILATVSQVLGNVTLAVSVVGMLVLSSGILILIGAISMTKFQRIYEAAILKTIGATTRHLAVMLAIEYGLLGVVAGVVGAVGAVSLSWAVRTLGLRRPMAPGGLGSGGWRAGVGRSGGRGGYSRQSRRASPPSARDAAGRLRGFPALNSAVIRRAMMTVRRVSGDAGVGAMSESYRNALLEKKAEILTTGGIRPIAAQMENNSRQGDLADQANGNNEVHIQLKLKQTDAKILQAIEEAIVRIDKGTYGICRDCGEPISPARLNAIPWTRVCITCKEKQNS